VIAVFHPDGTVASGFVADAGRPSRRRLRRTFAALMGEKWGELWERGYRLGTLT